MKLKSIAAALAYGRSREILVRSEGARRVKQAESRTKKATFNPSYKYGGSSVFFTMAKSRDHAVGTVLVEDDLDRIKLQEVINVDFSVLEVRVMAGHAADAGSFSWTN